MSFRDFNEVELQVANSHIYGATKGSPTSCPIARSASNLFGGSASVDGRYCTVNGMTFELPSDVTQKVANFDNGYGMQPFWFRMKRIR